MTFIYECIPEEFVEEVARITKDIDDISCPPNTWMFNKETSAYVLCFSVGNERDGESTAGRYALVVRGTPILFKALRKWEIVQVFRQEGGTPIPGKQKYSFKVYDVKTSKQQRVNSPEVIDTIRQAMTAFGFHYSNEFSQVIAVDVEL